MTKQQRYSVKMRSAGLRPIQIWVPDVRRKGFAAEVARQSRLTSASKDEKEVMDFIEAAMDWDEWVWEE